ncbi:hypothetical protein CSOJ01_12903 [Colletotrichum sojae]|uniref:Uncharacterized protein n=1 Tax=Colletotrichum sojae TaxID=2175907 RepID=A0A8H6ITU2_9PEZI|nr:hypothetical protein CSOJ01_12903 [Colletotrichum sojae]
MSQETQHPGPLKIHRKPLPSHYQPLARDETMIFSTEDPRAYDRKGETTYRARWRTGKGGNEGTEVETRAMVHEVADEPSDSNETPQKAHRRRHTLLEWWPEVVWCVVSVACIAVLVSVLSVYDDKPLPNWSLGLTLNTVIAFISTVCRTAFVIPVVETLSQSKWSWLKRHGPRPLKDFQVFDEASRGHWGSLKLLFTLKGRLVALLSAAILVTGIATSTVTQSVVTYPTRQVLAEGAATPLTKRNDKYFWATANRESTDVTDQLTIEHEPGSSYNLKSTLPNSMLFDPGNALGTALPQVQSDLPS